MRLKIEKFRAIKFAEIELGDTTAFVGQNGSGKSSALRALNAFFNFEEERADFEAGRHAYGRSTQAVVELTMRGITHHLATPTVRAGSDELRAQLKYRKQAVWTVFVDGRWLPAPPGFHKALRKQVTYALIPTRRDHEVAHGATTGLLERAVDAWVTSNRQRDRVSPQVAQLGAAIKKNSLGGFEKQLRKVAPVDGPFAFELGYEEAPDYRLLLNGLVLSVREGGQSIPLADSGSGTQSMAIFALYAYLAELESKTFVLGVEEPEQNLHPQAQRQLVKRVTGLGLQVVLTTHSPTVVDSLDHEQVVLCRRIRGTRRGLEVELRQISSDFFSRYGLDRDTYYRFHERRNSDFIFADFVVVTESPNDSAVVEALLRGSGADPTDLGMSIFSLDGVTQVPQMFYILRELGIANAFVVDKDYFLPYLNSKRDSSLNSKGFPQYKAQAKNSSVLDALFPDATARAKLVEQLVNNHRLAAVALQGMGFFCFKYALEVDVVISSAMRQELYAQLGIPAQDQTERSLLVSRAGVLKKQETLVPLVEVTRPSALPSSYKALRRELPRMAEAARQRP